jgi:Na+-translocating ferredoxin:NAD+ oxidoreductase RnfD subunit
VSTGFEDDYDRDDLGVPDDVPSANPSKITVPGTLLIAMGVVNLLVGLGMCFMGYVFSSLPEAEMKKALEMQNPEQRKALEKAGYGAKELQEIYVYGGGVGGAVSLLCSLLTILGGILMIARKARGLAIFSALTAVVPCCCLGLPIGIWALVVLLSQDVKSCFR